MNNGDQPSALTGRDAECAAVREIIDSARSGFSATLVLRGEAGIGKTSLLEYAAGTAPDFRTLRVTGIESEMEFGFAALHQLIQPFWEDVSLLPPPQHNALTAAFGIADGPAPDQFLVGLAVLTLLSAVTDDTGSGLLIAVDDAQWLDLTSANVLAFVARRLHADRVALVFTIRDAAGHQEVFEGLPSRRVTRLDAAAVSAVITGLAAGPVAPGVGDQIAERADGNPLALVETVRELSAQQLAGADLLPDPLPLASDVQERYWRKVARLPRFQQEFLLLAAAEPSCDRGLFERAAARLGLSPGLALTGQVREMVQLADRVIFRHPLIRSAVYTGSPHTSRRRVHEALAAVSDPDRDGDRVAWHRASAAQEPDEDIAALLERSAERAKKRGGFAAGAAFLRRAAELTPGERPRARRLLAAADAEFTAGRAAQAMTLIDQVGPRLSDPGRHATALRLRGAILMALGDGHRAPATLLQAARALAPLDPAAARDTLVDGMFSEFYCGGRAWLGTRAAIAADDRSRASSIPDLMLDGYAALLNDDTARAAPFLRRALDAIAADDLPDDQRLRWYGYGMWCATDLLDLRSWHLLADRWVTLCRAWGALTTLPLALDYLGLQQVHAGHLNAAEATNAEGRGILAATGTRDRMGIRGVELLSPAWRGQETALREVAASMTSDGAQHGQERTTFYPHVALAIFELGAGNYPAALSHARITLDENGPHAGSIILPYAVEAAVHCEDLPTAELALGRLEDRASASPTDWALGLRAQCQALVRGGGEREALFAKAVGHLERCQALADLARTRFLYGEWLRRQRRRREAIHELRLAHTTFEAIGAEKFAERTRLELVAAGAQEFTAPDRAKSPRLTDQLTERESQIARLVADGATNAEVAAQLFISANTVDYHLRHVYRKLGVHSRTMLAARFRDSF